MCIFTIPLRRGRSRSERERGANRPQGSMSGLPSPNRIPEVIVLMQLKSETEAEELLCSNSIGNLCVVVKRVGHSDKEYFLTR